jgi:folate-dependent phosphoribosylglycinamide formyltransferase PurN
MQIVLFVNDSIFSYALARELIEQFSEHIALVVLSEKHKSSFGAIRSVYRKCGTRYFAYRTFVEALSRLLSILSGRSVKALARRKRLDIISSRAINREMHRSGPFDLGITINFDQIIREETINRFRAGIINIHAGRLPLDRGISPVAWAYGRGDVELWTTLYYLDAGTDSGRVIEQFAIPVQSGASLFSNYLGVCRQAGRRMVSVVSKLLRGSCIAGYAQFGEGTYNSWPSDALDKMQRQNRRSYLRKGDIAILFGDDSPEFGQRSNVTRSKS